MIKSFNKIFILILTILIIGGPELNSVKAIEITQDKDRYIGFK